jgi:hypothetical protein
MSEYHKKDIEPYRKNLAFKQEFDLLGLDLNEVFEFTPLNLDMENRRLESLLDFVKKYQQYGSQETMELIEGSFCFPPIFPGISPESDWYRFELWMRGEPTRKTIAEQMPADFTVKNPDDIPEEEMEAELEKLREAMALAGYAIGLNDEVPARLIYRYLLEWIGEIKELDGPFGGGWVYDGCDGYCPGCFQRPWCESGQELCWTEDEEAGKMHLQDEVKEYVSASPQSLGLLQKSQDEHDAKYGKFEDEERRQGPFLDHEGLRDFSSSDELPF